MGAPPRISFSSRCCHFPCFFYSVACPPPLLLWHKNLVVAAAVELAWVAFVAGWVVSVSPESRRSWEACFGCLHAVFHCKSPSESPFGSRLDCPRFDLGHLLRRRIRRRCLVDAAAAAALAVVVVVVVVVFVLGGGSAPALS